MKLLYKSVLLVLGAVLFFAVVAVVVTWTPDKPIGELRAKWAQPPSQFMGVSGLNVHYRDEGPRDDPSPIVLLHGTSASLHTWQGWTDALVAKRRVIRMDLPGFALTGPDRNDDYSIANYALFVNLLVNKLQLQHFTLAGNSLGGQIAWNLALLMPERVDKLVLVDASGYPPESATVPIDVPVGFRIARLPLLRPVMSHVLPANVIANSVRNVYGDPAKVTPELIELYTDMTLRPGNRRALGLRMAQREASTPERIRRIKVPTLVLWGAKDRLVPLEFGKRFEQDIAGARLVVFEGLGHVPHEEDPQSTVRVVKEFLGM